jgi:hypothetical protein
MRRPPPPRRAKIDESTARPHAVMTHPARIRQNLKWIVYGAGLGKLML